MNRRVVAQQLLIRLPVTAVSAFYKAPNECYVCIAFHMREFIIYLRRSFLATIFPQGRRLKRAEQTESALYVVFCGGTKCPGGKHSVITGNNRSGGCPSHSAHTTLHAA